MFSRILVAVDKMPSAEKVLAHSIDLSKKYGARLIIAHIIINPPYGGTPSAISLIMTSIYAGETEDEGNTIISKAEKVAKASGITYSSKLLRGAPADQILRIAEQEKADLIVVGNEGPFSGRRFLRRNISYDVVRRSKCPILVIK